MPRISTLVTGLRDKPGYTIMRGLGRFGAVRRAVAGTKSVLGSGASRARLASCVERMDRTIFRGVDRDRFVSDLERDGVAFGLMLPREVVAEIRAWADRMPCYADRNPAQGFLPERRLEAERALGKTVLVAQYFNTSTDCPAVARLLGDPLLEWIAIRYLRSVPVLAGTNLWWTFPVQASAADRDRHAHLFHRDVDDFRFFKLFFYITDVGAGDGAHVCVVGSQDRPPLRSPGDHWSIRRYTDEEVAATYPKDRIVEITAPAGTGFAEDTLCIHKGLTPTLTPRLLLQVQYALFDYGTMHDRRNATELRSIA
jgi:hypothetical protein